MYILNTVLGEVASTADAANITQEIKEIIQNSDFIAFSQKNFNRELFDHILTLWQTQEAAQAWGETHPGTFTIEALETSQYSRDDFLSDTAMSQIKSGILSN